MRKPFESILEIGSRCLLASAACWQRLRSLSALHQLELPLRCLAAPPAAPNRPQAQPRRRSPAAAVVVAALGGTFGALLSAAQDNETGDELLACCRSGDANCVRRLIYRCRMLARARQSGGGDEASREAADPVSALVNSRHRLGWTALAAAVVNGHAEVARELLNHGADVNAGDDFAGSFAAAAQMRLSSAEVSSRRSSEFNARLNHSASFAGCTALHYAALMNALDMVQLLLEAKADPTLRNADGYRPSVFAPEGSEARRLLQSAEAEAERRRRREFPLERRLRESLIGQEAAIRCVAAAIRRKENGWSDSDHPLVFLFLGSSGVGKTELAKQVDVACFGELFLSEMGFLRMFPF